MRVAKPARLTSRDIPRHYHDRPYATLVIEGGYEEAGDQGRCQVSAGDILLHPAYSAHRDRVGDRRTYVLDIPLPFDGRAWPALATVADPDLVIRSANRDLREACEYLLAGLTPKAHERTDPVDQLAAALSGDPSLAIGEWASFHSLSREWLARRFQRHYGTDSAAFRSEARARLAWRRIVDSDDPLAQVAAQCGFADQSHMTRSVGRLTGRSPGAWRKAPSDHIGSRRAS